MKKLFALSMVIFLLVSVAACGGANNPPVAQQPAADSGAAAEAPAASADEAGSGEIAGELRIVWWGGDARHERTLEVIDMFEEKHPGITMVPEYMGGDAYWDKLATQVAGGNAPDVIQFGGNYPDYVGRDALLPLNSFFGNIIDISNIDQGVIDSATMNGNTYGLCLGTNMLGIAYNQTMMNDAGVTVPAPGYTWEDIGAFMEDLAGKLPAGVFPMTDNSGNNSNYLGYYSRQQGQNIFTAEGVTKSTPEMFTNFFNIWADWRAKSLIPSAETSTEFREDGADSSTLVAGRVAMSLIYSNQLVGFQDAMQDELSIMPLPDMNKNAAWIMPSQYFCISKQSALPEAAATFINFFVNDPDAGMILGNDRGISASSIVRAAVAENATPLEQKIYDLYAVAADHTTEMDPNVPNDQEFNDNFRRISQEVAFGVKDTATAGQEAFDMINDMIAKG